MAGGGQVAIDQAAEAEQILGDTRKLALSLPAEGDMAGHWPNTGLALALQGRWGQARPALWRDLRGAVAVYNYLPLIEVLPGVALALAGGDSYFASLHLRVFALNSDLLNTGYRILTHWRPMTPEHDRSLSAYADLIVRVGLNLRAGQRLLIRAPLETAPLARAIAARAYDHGARLVEAVYSDPHLQLTRFQHAPADSFEEHSTWPVTAGLEYVEAGHATVSITGSDPDLFKDVDPARIMAVRRAEGRAAAPLSRLITADAVNWCVVGYATPAWAARVFPALSPDEALAALWDAIFRSVRLDAPDPLAAWQAHTAELAARTAMLNERQYHALRFTGPGTDLTVGLPFDHRWLGGAAPTGNGITNVANLPTEEVFTAPDRARVNGTVRATMPLNLGGNLVDNFSLTFKDGRVVDLQAEKGEELLRALIETDEGAARLGELALVPAGSPISQTGILFYNTLFDENAASHIALGRAYANCIAGCEGLSDADFAARGGNSSIVHVDFMIGSAEIDVDGLSDDGAAEPLMRAGEWVN